MKINKINIFTTIFALVILTGTISAIANKYAPGETLNPACTPGEANCTVETAGGKFQDGVSDHSDAVFTGGKVGIGTTSPSQKLDVAGNAEINGQIMGTSRISFDQGDNFRIDTNSSGLLFDGGDGIWDFLIYDERVYLDNLTMGYGGGALLTTYNSNESLTIDPNGTGNVILQGNVGIGTTSPSEKLEVNGKIKAKEIITPGRGQTAWVGRMTSSDKDAGWGSYNDSGDSDQFDCTTHKADGYCVALTDGPFISHFNNPVKAACYWYLRRNTSNKSPYALNGTYVGAMKSISWYAHTGDKIGWYRSADNHYNGDCSNSAQSTGFTLMSI